MDSKEQRVLDALWQARYVDRENDGWVSVTDLWLRKIAPNRLGFRMGPGTIYITLWRLTLWRLEDQGWVESKWIDDGRLPSHPGDPRRRFYRITERGHHERARQPRRVRGSLPQKLRPEPEAG